MITSIAGQVPRVHALAIDRATGLEDLPVIAYQSNLELQSQIIELRKAALQFLQGLLFGDQIAAEYVLLQLVSRQVSDNSCLDEMSLLSHGIVRSGRKGAAHKS